MHDPATATSMRLLHLLQALPGPGRRRPVQELMRELQTQGYEVTVRMVQRDLEKLQAAGMVHSDGRKPAGWSRGSKGLGLQLRDPTEALALEILARHARHLLPPSVAERLRDRFEEARRTLGIHPGSDIARWAERIAVVPLSQPLIPPKVVASIQRVVLQALLEGRVLKIDYHARGGGQGAQRVVHPAGLVAREGQFVLVAFFAGSSTPYQLLLHRMRSAKALEDPAQVPGDFDLQAYAHSSAMGMGTGRWLRLALTTDEHAGRFFEESKLSEDQVVVGHALKSGAMRYRVTATVEESERLDAYLNSLGEHLIRRSQRVVPPPHFRSTRSTP